MEIDAITVTYYYIKEVTITVEYVDIDTNEKIEEEITINGHEGDEYSTEQKEIEGYEFIEVTEDKEGNMTEDKTITYYYKKVVSEPVEPTPEEPEQPTPPDSTPGNKGGDQTIADTIVPNETIIFLDEIQNCPNARTALKFLALDKRFDVIA